MFPTYLLCEAYLLLSAGLLLSDLTWSRLLFLVNMRSAFDNSKFLSRLVKLSGFAIAALLLLFPADPGPMFWGDLFPSSVCFLVSLLFLAIYRNGREKPVSAGLQHIMGRAALVTAALHLVLPTFVIL